MKQRSEMNHARKYGTKYGTKYGAAALGAALIGLLVAPQARAQVNANNWGRVTAPVFGSTDPTYPAELTAGPNKFGSYFAGVLPNGRKVIPAGVSAQIGMNPLGSVLTPDGKYLITTNDDERDGGSAPNGSSVHPPDNGGAVVNQGAYSVSVLDTATMRVVSQINTAGRFFIGLQATGPTNGPYTVYASGGADQDVKVFTVTAGGAISLSTKIVIPPITPVSQGFVSNYMVSSGFNPTAKPSGFSAGGAKITFPAGSALSPNGNFLYVACNGDNSLAVIDTTTNKYVKSIPVGYFPYGVSISRDGSRILVSNWGVSPYQFLPTGMPGSTGALTYDGGGSLASLARISPADGTTATRSAPGGPDVTDALFFVPATSVGGAAKTSSISVLTAPSGNGANASLLGSIYQGQPGGLDALYNVGETHPSATAIVRRGALEVLYVAKANSDSLGLMLVNNNRRLADFDLSPLQITLTDGHKVHGSYPNALAVSPGNTRLYVAEAGINSVAVLDVSTPTRPRLLGRIPTGWYPTSLSLSADGQTLYVTNAKGVGEDINPNVTPANNTNPHPATGQVADFPGVDSNYLYGSAQKISLANMTLDNTTALGNNFAVQNGALDTSIVPLGGPASTKIKHVFFILHENKTFDSMLGTESGHFGVFASAAFNFKDGSPYNVQPGLPNTSFQFNGVSLNTQLLATNFATGVNYYSDSEESDAGHQFAASGTATDYTEKTLLVKSGRGLLVNKNFEPEDYPEGGYLFNNAARNGVSFKDFGALIRIDGTDTGTSTAADTSSPGTQSAKINDPDSGLAGFPLLNGDGYSVKRDPLTGKVISTGDVNSQTTGLGQSYFLNLPILQILGTNDPRNGEPRLDRNYPGYNFNISDQRRALEFIKDFDRMVAAGTLPQFIYLYQPNDHTGGVQAGNASILTSPAQEVADGDVGLGMVVDHILKSNVYYNPATSTSAENGSAIFITYDDAQSTLDHIHPHRTPMIVVSPFAKPGYVAPKHYVTASIVKTEELLLGLPPNNYGDLFATDLRDMFQASYNGITAASLDPKFTRQAKYQATPEGMHVWKLVAKLDTSAPDRDSRRLGILARLSMVADDLHKAAVRKKHLHAAQYRATQARLYQAALKLVAAAPRDADD
jgi:YVTN family beta-propeller protein